MGRAAEFIKKNKVGEEEEEKHSQERMMPGRTAADDSAGEGLTTPVKSQRAEHCHLRGQPAKGSRLLLGLRQLRVNQSQRWYM